MNLHDLLAIPRARDPGKTALIFEGGAWSYERLFDAAHRVAGGLARRGIGPGDRVALFLGNSPGMAVSFLAILRLGAIALPVNTAYRRREIGHILADAEPALLISEAAQRQVLEEVAAEGAGDDIGAGAGTAVRIAREAVDIEILLSADAGPVPPLPRTGDALAMLLYTSGTTGRSKGAMITHANLTASITGLMAAWAWRPDDRLLLTLPLFHVHGLVVGLLTALAAGATVELERRFDAAEVTDRLARDGGPSVFFGVPTMYIRLVDELRRRRREEAVAPAPFPSARLFASGSAPLAPDTFAGFRDLTGHTILERYGMTETGITLSNPYAGERRPGSVGHPLPGISARIVGADGRPVPPGTEGELQVAGSGVCAGYWRDTEKTAAAFASDPGDAAGRRWFRTGDLARRDPVTGAHTLLGRSHDMILSAGYNVYPREVEEALEALPWVTEAAVAGLPDRDRGEVVAAWLVVVPGAGVPADDGLRDALADRLAAFKIPRQVFTVPELPRNALGKVQRHRLVPP